MKHLGDITKLSGFEIPPVDVITGGSPCQGLSQAGKRMGLMDERSGLFMEQIRIIKEMREADAKRGRTADAIRPRWMVWENVPGAFSSSKGEDFRAVLEETARIAGGDAVIPRPAGGKWANAGAIVGDGWSIAWRLHDAQFWGVPQRRKRIALVADFAGECAAEILFERESVCGDPAAGEKSGQGAAAGAEGGTDATDCNLAVARSLTVRHDGSPCGGRKYEVVLAQGFDGYNQQLTGEIAQTIRANKSDSDHVGMVLVPTVAHGLRAKASLSFREDADTLVCAAFMGGQGEKAGGIGYAEELSPTLKTTSSGGNTVPCLCLAGNTIDRQPQNGGNGSGWQEDVSYTLTSIDHAVAWNFDSLSSNSMKSANPDSGCRTTEIAKTIDTSTQDPSKNQGGILIMDARGNGSSAASPTLTGDHQAHISDYTAIAVQSVQQNADGEVRTGTVANTLNTNSNASGRNAPLVFSMQRSDEFKDSDVASTQRARQYKDATDLIAQDSPDNLYVRRLTPTECERLQGYPDGWTDIGAWTDTRGKLHKESSDSARYKALGNSIALPFWEWMLARIIAYCDRPATLGSLFDGIGGFPLCWQRAGGVPVWASEIEEFPIAVTRQRFERE